MKVYSWVREVSFHDFVETDKNRRKFMNFNLNVGFKILKVEFKGLNMGIKRLEVEFKRLNHGLRD